MFVPVELGGQKGVFNTSPRKARLNAAINSAKDVEWFTPGHPGLGDVMIVGAAPSLADNIDEIKRRHDDGVPLIALNGAGNFLLNHGVTPDAVVVVDCRPDNIVFIEQTPPEVVHLLASQCDPSLFRSLINRKSIVTLFHLVIDETHEKQLLKIMEGGRPVYVIDGGSTVMLRTIRLARAMGFDRMHLFGVDSCYRDDRHHAYDWKLNDSEDTKEVLWPVTGKTYRVAYWMARQVNEFWNEHVYQARAGVRLFAYGDGLLPDVCRHLNESLDGHSSSEKKQPSGEPVTILCVNVGPKYPMSAVAALRDMVLRHLPPGNHRFACVTDRPDDLPPGIDALPHDPRVPPSWWQKIKLFDPALGLTGRCVFFDLDVCITGPLDDLLDHPGIISDWNYPAYNSSVMVWDAGDHADIWSRFDPAMIDNKPADYPHNIWTDQDWMSIVGGWQTFPAGWCASYRSHAIDAPPAGAAVVCFHGDPKPWDVQGGWVPRVWGCESEGRVAA